MNDKWWYVIKSRSIMDNEEDKLEVYSFWKASEFYYEKVKKLRYEDIKNWYWIQIKNWRWAFTLWMIIFIQR